MGTVAGRVKVIRGGLGVETHPLSCEVSLVSTAADGLHHRYVKVM